MGSVKSPNSPASATPSRLGVDRFSVILVAVAATMWASDAYFRNQLVQHLSSPEIVVAEDGLVMLFLVPVLWRNRAELSFLGARGWLAVLIIAAGAQALATILFTASFSIAAQHQLFAETFVLQQTQPLIAIVLAWIVLGERRRPWFWPLAVVALGWPACVGGGGFVGFWDGAWSLCPGVDFLLEHDRASVHAGFPGAGGGGAGAGRCWRVRPLPFWRLRA
jgi:drug/metabolite transporter (DMT)-like permease